MKFLPSAFIFFFSLCALILSILGGLGYDGLSKLYWKAASLRVLGEKVATVAWVGLWTQCVNPENPQCTDLVPTDFQNRSPDEHLAASLGYINCVVAVGLLFAIFMTAGLPAGYRTTGVTLALVITLQIIALASSFYVFSRDVTFMKKSKSLLSLDQAYGPGIWINAGAFFGVLVGTVALCAYGNRDHWKRNQGSAPPQPMMQQTPYYNQHGMA